MRGLKSTIFFAVVLAALVGYIYKYEWGQSPSAESDKEKAFPGVESDRIEEVRITPAGSEAARLVKAAEGWQLTEPGKAEADASELSSITSNLSSLEVQRVVDENPSDLAQYGLDPPRVDVAFRLKDEKDFRRLMLGEKTPTGGDLYAKLEKDNKVFLVSSYLDSTFNRTPFDLRDKRVLAFDREKVDSVDLTTGSSSLQLARSGSDWKIAKPISARGEYGSIEGLVTRLSSAQMQRIVAPEASNLAEYGLDKPAATATINTGSARASLLFGKTQDGSVFAKDASRPMVFAVEESLLTDIKKEVGDFRRKDVFDFRSYNAERIQIARGGETVSFEKTKDKDGKEIWRTAAGETADTTKVEDLLTKLSNLRAESFLPERHAALKSPTLTVTVTHDGKTENVEMGRAGGDVYAARGDEAGSAKVETTPFEDALKALDALK